MLDFITTYNHFIESLDLLFLIIERIMTLIGAGGVLVMLLKKIKIWVPLFESDSDFKKIYVSSGYHNLYIKKKTIIVDNFEK
jgi:hypothetical protein